jgi:heparan-alpha-glucosaminide N-acetyltransferase
MQYNRLNNQRILSIDAFRGITILVMVFVNELAGMRNIPAWMKHMPADADAMSFVDVVFPAFLFIVGMSIPFAINNRLKKGDSFKQLQQHILFRTLGLLVLGFFMVNAEGGYDEALMRMSINLWTLLVFVAAILIWKVYYTKNKIFIYTLRTIGFIGLIILAFIYKRENGAPITPRWWGILGLIGWAYFYSCIFYQLCKGNKYQLAALIAFCAAFYAIGSMQAVKDSTWLNWISAQKGNAAHTSIVLSGIVLTLIFFDETKPATTKKRFTQALVFTVLLFAVGYFLRPYFKISKIHATPTWCLYSAGFCCIVFAFLYWLIDMKKNKSWTSFLKPAASNPLLTYIIPDIIYYSTALFGISLLPEGLRYGWIGILWSVIFSFLVLGIASLLSRWRLKLQL